MKLRLAHVIVQPVLVWDDGEEITAGPSVQPMNLTQSALERFVVDLPNQVASLAVGQEPPT